MGAWGVKLDQNDIYADVRDLYTALLRCGLSDEDALNKTQEKFSAYAEDDNLLFRLSLADVMFRLGRLTNEVRDNALHIIDSGADLDTWYQSSQELGDARRDILAALKDQLCGEQPAKKKIGKKRIFLHYSCITVILVFKNHISKLKCVYKFLTKLFCNRTVMRN